LGRAAGLPKEGGTPSPFFKTLSLCFQVAFYGGVRWRKKDHLKRNIGGGASSSQPTGPVVIGEKLVVKCKGCVEVDAIRNGWLLTKMGHIFINVGETRFPRSRTREEKVSSTKKNERVKIKWETKLNSRSWDGRGESYEWGGLSECVVSSILRRNHHGEKLKRSFRLAHRGKGLVRGTGEKKKRSTHDETKNLVVGGGKHPHYTKGDCERIRKN